jgi:hypothetical protein
MSRHRFLDQLRTEPAVPAGVVPALASGFMACPLVLQAPMAWQQQIYQWAFEQAVAVVRPSRLERWQTATLN